MSSAIPVIRQISWLAVLPQLLALFAAIAASYVMGATNPFVIGSAVYLAYSIISRQLIARAHRDGIRSVKAERFADAIPKFQESFDFFDRRKWIDQYRAVVLMSPSAASYREMALANIAFCYGQLGDAVQSRASYRKCLDLFPDSGLARTALRMLDSTSTA